MLCCNLHSEVLCSEVVNKYIFTHQAAQSDEVYHAHVHVHVYNITWVEEKYGPVLHEYFPNRRRRDTLLDTAQQKDHMSILDGMPTMHIPHSDSINSTTGINWPAYRQNDVTDGGSTR